MDGKKGKAPDKHPAGYLDLSALMSNLPGMVYRCRNDEDWTMEFVSDGCFILTGFTAEQLVSNAFISYGGLIHPEDRLMVWEEVNQGIENRRPFRMVYRIIAEGGIEKWVYEQGQGVFDSGNELKAIEGFITDISEQKRAEIELEKALEEKKLIVSEIHHRIKNNMQQIISMLSVQALSTPECSEVLDSVIERVTIFTEMHQDLYSYDNRDLVNLVDHVRRNFTNLLMTYNISPERVKLELEISDEWFEFDTAIPLGLMFNELITNSLKYAFGDGSGLISISILKSPGGNVERIEYTDDGTALGSTSGFGTLLLESLAAQLGLDTEIKSGGNKKYLFIRR